MIPEVLISRLPNSDVVEISSPGNQFGFNLYRSRIQGSVTILLLCVKESGD
jgi:hypothetical protein